MTGTVAELPRRSLYLAAFIGMLAALAPLAPVPAILALAGVALFVWTALDPGRWIVLFLAAALLLPPLPIPIGDSGPHPSLAFVLTGVLAGAAYLDRWRLRMDLLSVSLLSLATMLLASTIPAALYSGVPLAIQSVARVCLFGISVYLFLYVRNGPPVAASADRILKVLYAAACAAALFACVDFYFQFPAPAGFGPQFVWLDTGVYRRAQGLFYEASTLGNFCMFFLVMAVVALLHRPQQRVLPRSALVIGSVVFGTALVLSYSRASLISLAAAVSAALFLNRSRLRVRRLGIVAFMLIAAAGLALAFLPEFARLYGIRLIASAQYFFTAPELVLSGRLESWRILIDFVVQHPLQALAGVGYKTLPYSDVAGQPVVADNMYLSIFIETGIAGLAALLLFCFAALRASYRASASRDALRSFFGAWFFCFWIGQMLQMLSGDILTYWRVLPVYFWVLAMATRDEGET